MIKIALTRMAVHNVKLIIIMFVANNHQFVFGAVVTTFYKLKKVSNVTMVTQQLMMAAQTFVRFFPIGLAIIHKAILLFVSTWRLVEMER